MTNTALTQMFIFRELKNIHLTPLRNKGNKKGLETIIGKVENSFTEERITAIRIWKLCCIYQVLMQM